MPGPIINNARLETDAKPASHSDSDPGHSKQSDDDDDIVRRINGLSIKPRQNGNVDGKTMVNGNLIGAAPARGRNQIAPLVKPSRSGTSSVSSAMFSEALRKRPPSPTKSSNALDLKPSGSFEESVGLLDPKSSEWSKPVDIKSLRETMELQSKVPIEQLHSRNKYGFLPPAASKSLTTESDFYNLPSAEEQFKQMVKIIDEGGETADDEGILEIEGLVPRLMPHQSVGVRFMARREAVPEGSGGLLCDDMGLGKTVQSIGIILYRPPAPDAKVRQTLIVCPLSLVSQWNEEIMAKAPQLDVHLYHGNGRYMDPDADVVITTYNLVAREFSYIDSKQEAPLFETKWYRIIADEAHAFRSVKSKSSLGMDRLCSDGRRWALTGTPVHNNYDDLFSMLRFVRIPHYTDYKIWKAKITGPIKSLSAESRARAIHRIRTLLGAIMLRRRQSLLKQVLPTRNIERITVTLTESENQQIEEAHGIFKKDNSQTVRRRGTEASHLKLLMSLRKACNNIPPTNRDDGIPESKESKEKLISDLCGDVTIESLIEELGKTSLNDDESSSVSAAEGSKITALRKILRKERERKTVVFSSFTSYFPQITALLDQEGLKYETYHGNTPAAARARILHDFREDSSIKVLLCSLSCAAVGLNIVCANRVVLMEPWWNPMISEQAINRVYRLGQTQHVDVYQFMAENSLEERIFKIQERKIKMANGVLEGDSTKVTPEELKWIIYGGKMPDSISQSVLEN